MEAVARPFYVIENLVQYDLTLAEAETLIQMGMIFVPDQGDGDYGDTERPLTAFVWNDLDLDSGQAFDLFDAILGRNTSESSPTRSAAELPEGLHMEITGSECVLLDAQEHKWLTIHCGANGDPESWQTAIIGRVLDAFGLKRSTAEAKP